ncbi:MAG: hypothetical protein C0434_02530 [Xanthomonadaceae bacterium]|nr:hypothetical protein [Xanthomonadaceae bacterium]
MAQRLRAALWAINLGRVSGLSYGALDARLVPREPRENQHVPRALKGDVSPKARIRALDRIARHGDDPERAYGGGLRSVDLVQIAAEQWPGSDADYRAPLWKVLTGKAMPGERELEELLADALHRIGALQPTKFADTGTLFCGPGYPAIPGDLRAIGRGAKLLAEKGSLDAVMALALLTRKAVERYSLIEGQLYLDALPVCCERYENQIGAGPFVRMLHGLVRLRLIHDDWNSIDPVYWPYNSLLRKQQREEARNSPGFISFLRDDHEPFAKNRWNRHKGVPVVELDPRHEWIEKAAGIMTLELHDARRRRSTINPPMVAPLSPALQIASQLWPSRAPWLTLFLPDNAIVAVDNGHGWPDSGEQN